MEQATKRNGNRPVTENHICNFETRNCTVKAVKTANVLDRDRGNIRVLEISNLSNLSDPTDKDNGHIVPVWEGIDNEIFKPGNFLKRAIEQQFLWGRDIETLYPNRFRDKETRTDRYVHEAIFNEGYSKDTLVEISTTLECAWTETKRAQLISGFDEKTWININKFVRTGIEEKNILIARELDYNIRRKCEHLPMIWSVYNFRTPSMSQGRIIYAQPSSQKYTYIEDMLRLISSRYLVNVICYKNAEKKFEPLTGSKAVAWTDINVMPILIVDLERKDIFFIKSDQTKFLSFSKSKESLDSGHIIQKEFRKICADANKKSELTEVRGLVPKEINEMFGTSEYILALKLEILLHILLDFDHSESQLGVEYNEVDMSSKLIRMCNDCLKLPNLKIMYWARTWWAITRGELGRETKKMFQFNSNRGLIDVPRSSWDYNKRYELSFKQYKEKNLPETAFTEVLKTFNNDNLISFSKNVYVSKFLFTKSMEFTNGIAVPVFASFIDSINATYSNEGGPRLYFQKELEYMMTNSSAEKYRKRLTTRLALGEQVFFYLSYSVTEGAIARNPKTGGHSCLCRVWLEDFLDENSSNTFRLVVQWLEGFFDNYFKVCAVPVLTYLSHFFGVEVRQINFDKAKTFDIKDTSGPCVPTALFAANERIRTLTHSNGKEDWNPYSLEKEEARKYITEFMNSFLLIPLGDSLCAPVLGDRTALPIKEGKNNQ